MGVSLVANFGIICYGRNRKLIHGRNRKLIHEVI